MHSYHDRRSPVVKYIDEFGCIANLSKSVLNRHEQVREWAIRLKSKCYAIPNKYKNKESKKRRKKNGKNEDEIHRQKH